MHLDYNAYHKIIRSLANSEAIGFENFVRYLVDRLVFVRRQIARFAITDVLLTVPKHRLLMESKGLRNKFERVIMNQFYVQAEEDIKYFNTLWHDKMFSKVDLAEMQHNQHDLLNHFPWIDESQLSPQPLQHIPTSHKPEPKLGKNSEETTVEKGEDAIRVVQVSSHLLFLNRVLMFLDAARHHIEATWMTDLVEDHSAADIIEREVLPPANSGMTEADILKEFGIGELRALQADLARLQKERVNLLSNATTDFLGAYARLGQLLSTQSPW